MLRFEGVVLLGGNQSASALSAPLLKESIRAKAFPTPFAFGVQPRLTSLPNPLRRLLQEKVASTPRWTAFGLTNCFRSEGRDHGRRPMDRARANGDARSHAGTCVRGENRGEVRGPPARS